MTGPDTDTAREWRMPPLTREGQIAFWNRQAPGYAQVDMTRDNEGEAALVRTAAFGLVSHGHVLEDVVTLGGAVGSRDPVMIMDILQPSPSRIYFNDLSPEMTRIARDESLAPFADQGIATHLLAGRVDEIESEIPQAPRHVVIGVYRAAALLNSYPLQGYPRSGVDEYLHNHRIIGDTLLLEAMAIDQGGRYQDIGVRVAIAVSSSETEKERAMLTLWNAIRSGEAHVVRVVGLQGEREGFFISHWFTERGILNLVRAVFTEDLRRSITMEQCAKGFVLSIGPRKRATGIVTMLNNVLGNILPDDQLATLAAISRLSE